MTTTKQRRLLLGAEKIVGNSYMCNYQLSVFQSISQLRTFTTTSVDVGESFLVVECQARGYNLVDLKILAPSTIGWITLRQEEFDSLVLNQQITSNKRLFAKADLFLSAKRKLTTTTMMVVGKLYRCWGISPLLYKDEDGAYFRTPTSCVGQIPQLEIFLVVDKKSHLESSIVKVLTPSTVGWFAIYADYVRLNKDLEKFGWCIEEVTGEDDSSKPP